MINGMISIIIPAYNAEKTISRTLESVISQSYKNIEVIVVNDGSVDSTCSILKSYEDKNNNIHVINQSNSGVSISRNNGLKKSIGEFVLFLDSDDTLEQCACEKMLTAYNDCVELVVCGLTIIQDGKILRTPHLENQVIELKNDIDKYWELRKINLGPCNKLYRKDSIKNEFDESLSFGEDTKFVIDYLRNINNIKIISDCLYNVYLDNVNSLNRGTKSNKLPQLLEVRKYEEDFLNLYYPKNKDSRIHQRYFLDLHVVVTSIIKENPKKVAVSLIKEKLDSYDYECHFSFAKFKHIYYKLFALFCVLGDATLIYYLILLRMKIGAL